MVRPKRYIATISFFSVLMILLTACNGNNGLVRKHLADETNYAPFHGEICDVFYLDPEYKRVSILSSEGSHECGVLFEVVFQDHDTVKTFLGGEPDPERPLDAFRFIFQVTKENDQILFENGFYSAVSMNAPIEITASSLIYMDQDLFFIAAVNYNETEYLRFEDGIRNIKAFITEH